MKDTGKSGFSSPGAKRTGVAPAPDVQAILKTMNWDDRLRDARERRKKELAKVKRKPIAAAAPVQTPPPVKTVPPPAVPSATAAAAGMRPSLGRTGLDWMRVGVAMAGGLAVGLALGGVLFLPVSGYLAQNARPEAVPARVAFTPPLSVPDTFAARLQPIAAPDIGPTRPTRMAGLTSANRPIAVPSMVPDRIPLRAGGFSTRAAALDPAGRSAPAATELPGIWPVTLSKVHPLPVPAAPGPDKADGLPAVPAALTRPATLLRAEPVLAQAATEDPVAMLQPASFGRLPVPFGTLATLTNPGNDPGPRWLPDAPRRLAALPGVTASPVPRARPGAAPPSPLNVTLFVPPTMTPLETDFLMLLFKGNGIDALAQPSPFSISTTQVRYYHARDRDGAETVAAIAGGVARDFTAHQPPPPVGTLELWLEGAVPQTEVGTLVFAAPVVEEIILISAPTPTRSRDDRTSSRDSRDEPRDTSPSDTPSSSDEPRKTKGRSDDKKGGGKGSLRKK